MLVPIVSNVASPVCTPLTFIGIGITFIYYVGLFDSALEEFENLPEQWGIPESLQGCVDYDMVDD